MIGHPVSPTLIISLILLWITKNTKLFSYLLILCACLYPLTTLKILVFASCIRLLPACFNIQASLLYNKAGTTVCEISIVYPAYTDFFVYCIHLSQRRGNLVAEVLKLFQLLKAAVINAILDHSIFLPLILDFAFDICNYNF